MKLLLFLFCFSLFTFANVESEAKGVGRKAKETMRLGIGRCRLKAKITVDGKDKKVVDQELSEKMKKCVDVGNRTQANEKLKAIKSNFHTALSTVGGALQKAYDNQASSKYTKITATKNAIEDAQEKVEEIYKRLAKEMLCNPDQEGNPPNKDFHEFVETLVKTNRELCVNKRSYFTAKNLLIGGGLAGAGFGIHKLLNKKDDDDDDDGGCHLDRVGFNSRVKSHCATSFKSICFKNSDTQGCSAFTQNYCQNDKVNDRYCVFQRSLTYCSGSSQLAPSCRWLSVTESCGPDINDNACNYPLRRSEYETICQNHPSDPICILYFGDN